MIIGQIGHGLVDPFLLIPALPEMIDVAMEKFPHDEYLVNDLSSGIFNACISMGQLAGPIYGALMSEFTNFRLCCDYAAITMVVFALIYFIFGHGWSSFRDSKCEHVEAAHKLNFSIFVDIPTAMNKTRLSVAYERHDWTSHNMSMTMHHQFSVMHRTNTFSKRPSVKYN
jgi:MFS family permease